MGTHVGLFTIVVDDYDDAIEFYTKALGFELSEDVDQGAKRWVVVRPPGAETGILLARADGEAQETAVGNQTGGRVGFFLYTDDFAGRYAHMQDAGVVFTEEPRHEPYGTVVVFEDRCGNRWDLIEPGGSP